LLGSKEDTIHIKFYIKPLHKTFLFPSVVQHFINLISLFTLHVSARTVKGRPAAEKGATHTPYDKRNGGTRHGDQATHNNSKNRRDTVRKNRGEKFLKINF
jgi:hypothetical protein